MRSLLFLTCGLMSLVLVSCTRSAPLDLSEIDPGSYDSTWYNRAPLRFIQTNLNERDAGMDVEVYMQSLINASASMIVFNVGGIRAFYPTELPWHYRNPFLEGDRDLVKEVLSECHEKGIKFIARFDMSKINESIAVKKPEWLYVGTDGNNVNYNGEFHTCVNGGYQQEYVFEILREAITAYPFDGIFFNMGGYQTSDYSQVNHGICQCDNCKSRFRDSTGFDLPLRADPTNPVYRAYREFQAETSDELNSRVKSFIKSLDPGLIFQHRQGELVRSESGTAFTSGTDWNYHATENVKRTLNSYRDQTPNDTYNYLMGMDYRHTATSPNIGRIFLAEQMLNGAGPGIYFMGRIETQPDRVFLDTFREMFAFHKTHEKLFTNVESRANAGVIMGSDRDYRGIMKLLTEEHIMYDLIQTNAVGSDRMPRRLEDYELLILSNVTDMSEHLVNLIDNYVKQGGKLLVTGFPIREASSEEMIGKIGLQSLGVMPGYELFSGPRSTYLKVSEEDRLLLGEDAFEDFDVIMMNSEFLKCRTLENAETYLRLVPNTMHGPPEKCYFTEEDVTEFPGMISNDFGAGRTVFIPWLIGRQYEWKGNNGQRALFMAALENLLKVEGSIKTDASPLIEMTHMRNRNGAFEWIGMINHSGQTGDAFRDPVPVHNINIRFKSLKPLKKVYLPRSGKELAFRQRDGWIDCVVPEVNDFEMVVCLYKYLD
jgi:hypothetical protein